MVMSLNRNDQSSRSAVIMGCGQLGVSITLALLEEGYAVHILDLIPDAFERLPSGPIEDGDIIPIIGDGTLERDLRRASIQDADVFIATCGRDTRNALASQIAKHIFQIQTVICRMNDPIRKELYDGLGLIAISGTGLVTKMVTESIRI